MFKFRFSPEKPLLQYNKSDTGVIISIILLLGLGLVTLYVCSADYSAARFRGDSLYLVKRQFICALIGLVGMVFIASIRLDVIKKFLPQILLLLIIFINGIPKILIHIFFYLKRQPNNAIFLIV